MSRLYVETNFVLELVFAQEQAEACERLLAAAEQERFELVLPAYCLSEPLETLGRRHKQRQQLQAGVQRELRQLARSADYREVARQVDLAVGLFARSAVEELQRLELYMKRLVASSALVALTADVVERSFVLHEELDLDLQGAVVLASVSSHLDEEPATATFVTTNAKDFDVPEVHAHLEDRSCRLVTRFGDAVGAVLADSL